MGNRGRLGAAVVIIAAALAGCGTRLPNSAFVRAGQVASSDNNSPVAGQPTSPGAATSTGPADTTAVGSNNNNVASTATGTATGNGGAQPGHPRKTPAGYAAATARRQH